MKRAPKTMMNFAFALIALVIAVQVAWAMIAPIIGPVVLVFSIIVAIVLVARAYKWFADHR